MRISKVALKFSLIVIILLLISIFSLAGLVMRQRENSFIREMEVKAKFFARSAREAMFPKRDLFQIHFALTEILKEKGILYASVFDENGKFIDHSQRKLVGFSEKTAVAGKSVQTEKILIQKYKQQGQGFYDVTVPIFIGSKKIGGVRVGFSDKSIKDALAKVKNKIFGISLSILAVAVFVTFVSVGFMVKPINELAKDAAEIGKGNLNIEVKEAGKDEIGDLSRTFKQMIKGLKEREFLRDTFGKYVNPEVARLALGGKLRLGGEKKNVTILLSDIRSFTSMSEKLPPENLVKLLNEFFDVMVEAIVSFGGNIDKYIGDAILSTFGAPLDLPQHPLQACKAAVEMQKRLKNFNKNHSLNMRNGIAIHTGEVIAGNIGSSKKMEYTSIGDTVNTAARIEPLNKKYGTDIIISETTYQLVSEKVEAKFLGEETLRGKKEPLKIYHLLAVLAVKD